MMLHDGAWWRVGRAGRGAGVLALALSLVAVGCGGAEPRKTQADANRTTDRGDAGARVDTPKSGGGATTEPAKQTRQKEPIVHLVVDVSGSMKGYAEGNGCYDRLFTELLDQVLADVRAVTFRSWVVGDKLETGPDLAAVPRLAGAANYRALRSAFGESLASREVFPRDSRENLVAILVSDLEPDVLNPQQGCAGNGSVTCLKKAMSELAGRGWHLWVIGFETPFSGRRFYPRFDSEGNVDTKHFNELRARPTPVYALVAALDEGAGAALGAHLFEKLRSCEPQARYLKLTNLPKPRGSIGFARRRMGEIQGKSGRMALALASTGEVRDEARYRLFSEDDVEFALPVTASLEIGSATVPEIKWDLAARLAGNSGAEGGGVNLTLAPSAVLSADSPAYSGTLTVRIRKATLRRMADGGGFRIELVAHTNGLASKPWADWSYTRAEDPAEPRYATQTFRTAEVLGGIVEDSMGGKNEVFIDSFSFKFER